MAKILLTDKGVKAIKPAPTGQRVNTYDSQVPGFAVRTTDKGAKTYVLIARLKGESAPTRFTIGPVERVSLAAARDKVRDWLDQIAAGRDPRQVEEQAQAAKVQAERKAEGDSFRLNTERYIETMLNHQKNGDEIKRILHNEFIAVWGDKPIDAISTKDVADVIRAKAKKTPGQARAALNHVKQMFKWLANAGDIKVSPAQGIDAVRLLGPLPVRERILEDGELAKVWATAKAWGYPYGTIYQLLILTGCRLNEVAQGRWREIDLDAKTWTIPADRMKGKLAHVIPLTPMMIEVLRQVPQGDYLFSKNDGFSPVYTNRMQDLMHEQTKVTGWVNHDLRRTMRSKLSDEDMGISEIVQELMIAHRLQGVKKVYNKHHYLKEKTAGFLAWETRLKQIVKGTKPLRLAA